MTEINVVCFTRRTFKTMLRAFLCVTATLIVVVVLVEIQAV
jgi:hypothetical protein